MQRKKNWNYSIEQNDKWEEKLKRAEEKEKYEFNGKIICKIRPTNPAQTSDSPNSQIKQRDPKGCTRGARKSSRST